MNQAPPSKNLAGMEAKLAALKGIAAAMARQVDVEVQPLFSEVLGQACRALGAPMACLHLADPESGLLKLVASQGLDPVRSRAWGRLEISGSTPTAAAFNSGQVKQALGSKAPPGLGGMVSAPVLGVEIGIGSLSLLWPSQSPPARDPQRPDFLLTVGYLVGIAIEHAGLVNEMADNYNSILRLKEDLEQRNKTLGQLNQLLEELSVTDGLTGLSNRRYLGRRLEEEIMRSRRVGQPLTMIMADLDHFKGLNDKLGHQQGDEALRRFASWLRDGVRQVDTVGRYGGEEFMVLLVNCNLEQGHKVADKLRRKVQRLSQDPPFDSLGGFTVSMGVAQLLNGQDGGELLAAADQALYQAKADGRNRVCSAPLAA